MHTTLATFALMLLHGIASAGLLPEPERAQLTQRVLQAFWGKAVNSAGGVIQPLDERDRNTVPITDSQVQHAIDSTNAADANSGIATRLNLGVVAAMKYVQSGDSRTRP